MAPEPKLTDLDVARLRREYAIEGRTLVDLAADFNITREHAGLLVREVKRPVIDSARALNLDQGAVKAVQGYLAGLRLDSHGEALAAVAVTLATKLDACAANTSGTAASAMPRLSAELVNVVARLRESAPREPGKLDRLRRRHAERRLTAGFAPFTDEDTPAPVAPADTGRDTGMDTSMFRPVNGAHREPRKCVKCGQPASSQLHHYCDQCRAETEAAKLAARRAKDRKRPLRADHNKRYGHRHRRERARWKSLVDRGQAVCARCSEPILPGQDFDLDHRDGGKAHEWIGISHSRCNRAAGQNNRNGGN